MQTAFRHVPARERIKAPRAFLVLDAVKDSPLQAGKVIRGENGNFANRKKNSFLFYKNLV